jgi:MFS family permease
MKQINQQQIGRIYRQILYPKERRHLFLVIAALLAGILGAVLIGWYQFFVTVVLWVGIISALLSLTSFVFAKILERSFKQPDSLQDMVRRIDEHSLRFLAWFIGHNLLWIAFGNLTTVFLIYLWGPQRWVLLYVAGSLAYTFYAYCGVLLLPSFLRTNLAICWLGEAPMNIHNLLERASATVILREHFDANVRLQPDLIRAKAKFVALRQDARVAGNKQTSWRPINKLNKQRSFWLEFRNRFYVFACLFFVAFCLHFLMLAAGIGLPSYDGVGSPTAIAVTYQDDSETIEGMVDPESVPYFDTVVQNEEATPSSEIATGPNEIAGNGQEQGANGNDRTDGSDENQLDGSDSSSANGQAQPDDANGNGSGGQTADTQQINGEANGDGSGSVGGADDDTEEDSGDTQAGNGTGDVGDDDTQPGDSVAGDTESNGDNDGQTEDDAGSFGQQTETESDVDESTPGENGNGESGLGEAMPETNHENGEGSIVPDAESDEPSTEPQDEGSPNGSEQENDQGNESDNDGLGEMGDGPEDGRTPPPTGDEGFSDTDGQPEESVSESTPSPARPTDQMFLLEIPAMQPVTGNGTADADRPDSDSDLPIADPIFAVQPENASSSVTFIQQIPHRIRAIFQQLLTRRR